MHKHGTVMHKEIVPVDCNPLVRQHDSSQKSFMIEKHLHLVAIVMDSEGTLENTSQPFV